MKAIIRGRDSGKAKELLAYARKHHAAVLTQDKHTFKVKAAGYGYDDIEILDSQDLHNDNYDWQIPIVVHNGDKLLYTLMNKYYGLTVCGFTATIDKEK